MYLYLPYLIVLLAGNVNAERLTFWFVDAKIGFKQFLRRRVNTVLIWFFFLLSILTISVPLSPSSVAETNTPFSAAKSSNETLVHRGEARENFDYVSVRIHSICCTTFANTILACSCSGSPNSAAANTHTRANPYRERPNCL